MEKLYPLKALVVTIVCLCIFASVSAQVDIITAENSVQQGFGSGLNTRTVYDTVAMPHSLGAYGQINLHVSLACAGGGCDPWDRLAHVRMVRLHGSNWYEIARYVTPYGIGCDWEFDVTDYRYLLTDTIVLESFIDTWVNPAWLVTLKFEMTAGTPNTDSIQITTLWNNYNVVYGDTSQPLNIPPYNTTPVAAADSVKLKMTCTGHGQANLNNAAEFYETIDSVLLNDSVYFLQDLWRSDCATNVCSPQNGTYQYSRAGWCPGKSVIPSTFDIPVHLATGQSVKVGYNLQSYFNTCSPHYQGCVDGVTCGQCAYDGGSHTEPYYAIDGQLITYFKISTGVTELSKADITISPNPGKGLFKLHIGTIDKGCIVMVYDCLGNVLLHNEVTTSETTVNLQNMAHGIYFVKVQDGQWFKTLKVVKE